MEYVIVLARRTRRQADKENLGPDAFSRMPLQIDEEPFGVNDSFSDDPIWSPCRYP